LRLAVSESQSKIQIAFRFLLRLNQPPTANR
jgi:hypothetical protein